MTKKKPVEITGSILNMTLEDVMEDRFSAYAKDIIQERALPDARDGLKPAQRRIIYSMYLDGNTYNHPTRKSAKTVGNVIGTLHPHGDSSVYEAMVRMSQDWKMRLPLVQMQGNNGSIDDDPPAAMRYTEARLSKAADLLTADLDKETVNWAPNYDDTMKEPTVLPARFPNLLVNGAKGIAEGYSTEIAPHNLGEVIDATIYLVNKPDASLEEIMKIIPGPDFPTGGIVQGYQGIKDAFETGKGSIIVRSKVEILNNTKIPQLVITEIPYDVIKHDLIKRINKVRFDKEIDGISDVIDETDLNGLKIVVELKEGIDPQLILNYLYKKTNLQTSYNYNMVAIVDRCPKQIGLIDLLEAFIDARKDVITKRTQFDLNKRLDRFHIIEGLIKAVSILDEVIKTIRASNDKADSIHNLIKEFDFTQAQAEAIVMMQLYRLSNTDIVALRKELSTLKNEIKELKNILKDPKVLDEVMIKELETIKTDFPLARKTKIEKEIEEIVIDKTQMIAHEQVMLTLSRDGYVKKVSLRSYNAVADNLTGLKKGDKLVGQVQADSLNYLVAFSDQGNYLIQPLHQLDEFKWKDIGVHLNKYVNLADSEKMVDAVIVPDFNSYCWIVSVTRNGKIKRTPLKSFELSRYSRTSAAMNIARGDQVIRTFLVYGNEDVLLVTKTGYGLRYPVSSIPAVNCHSNGVISMKLGKDDYVSAACVISPNDSDLVLMGEKSQVKRFKQNEVETRKRAQKGELLAKINKSNPNYVADILSGKIDDNFYLITETEYTEYQFKDITLMNTSATYSSALITGEDWFIPRKIDVVRFVKAPHNPEKLPSNDNYDMIHFNV